MQLLSPGAGILGNTAATVSGSLAVNSALPTNGSGATLVDASSPADAIGQAVAGTVTVQFGSSTYSYAMGPGSVGGSAVEHKAFLYDGTAIWLEDLAASGSSDWDYNDHSWHATATPRGTTIDHTIIIDDPPFVPGVPPSPPPGVPPASSVPPVPPSPPSPPPPAPQAVWITADQDADEEGPHAGLFTVHRSDGTGALTVSYATSGTATNGADYSGPTASTGSVSFAAGVTEVQINVNPVDDALEEPTETVTLTLADGDGGTYAVDHTSKDGTASGGSYSVDGSGATVNIFDNDTPPVVWITGDQDAHEQGEQKGWFTVHRSGDRGSLTVYYSTPSGTATLGADYTGPAANNGSVTFAPGEMEKPIDVNPVSDTIDEPDESVTIALTLPPSSTGGSPGPATPGPIQPAPTGRSSYTIDPQAPAATILIHDQKDVTVEFVDAAEKSTTKLRIARWDNAFEREQVNYKTLTLPVTA